MTVMIEEITLDVVLSLARQLRPSDQAQLVTRLAPEPKTLMEQIEAAPVIPRSPAESIYGILSDLGPGPSAEEIDEVRREMWSYLDALEV